MKLVQPVNKMHFVLSYHVGRSWMGDHVVSTPDVQLSRLVISYEIRDNSYNIHCHLKCLYSYTLFLFLNIFLLFYTNYLKNYA